MIYKAGFHTGVLLVAGGVLRAGTRPPSPLDALNLFLGPQKSATNKILSISNFETLRGDRLLLGGGHPLCMQHR